MFHSDKSNVEKIDPIAISAQQIQNANHGYGIQMNILYSEKAKAETLLQEAVNSAPLKHDDDKHQISPGLFSAAKIYYANKKLNAIHLQIYTIETIKRSLDNSYYLSNRDYRQENHLILHIKSLTLIAESSCQLISNPKHTVCLIAAYFSSEISILPDLQNSTYALSDATRPYPDDVQAVINMLNIEQNEYMTQRKQIYVKLIANNALASLKIPQDTEFGEDIPGRRKAYRKEISEILERRYKRQLLLLEMKIQDSKKLISQKNLLTDQSKESNVLSHFNTYLELYHEDIKRQYDKSKNNYDELHALNMRLNDCHLMLNDLTNIKENRARFLKSNVKGYGKYIALGLANALLLVCGALSVVAIGYAGYLLGLAMIGANFNVILLGLQGGLMACLGYVSYKGVRLTRYAGAEMASNKNNFWSVREHNKLVNNLAESRMEVSSSLCM